MTQTCKNIEISTLMQQSGVKFGTSGARGLVTDMSDEVCYAYTLAFIQHLQYINDLQADSSIAIAGDFRSSTPKILAAVAMAIHDSGYTPVYCGFVPTPAIACYAMSQQIPCIMVTGSHIPDDRNGIKFYKSTGEILKGDEHSMCAQTVEIAHSCFDKHGNAYTPYTLPATINDAYIMFI
ncbi:MAG: hypothetical protein Q9M21_05395, partial [Mariprofundaceae bacterium]|nr:hypothetical protein [Mariprofundaceae bacterium]